MLKFVARIIIRQVVLLIRLKPKKAKNLTRTYYELINQCPKLHVPINVSCFRRISKPTCCPHTA